MKLIIAIMTGVMTTSVAVALITYVILLLFMSTGSSNRNGISGVAGLLIGILVGMNVGEGEQ